MEILIKILTIYVTGCILSYGRVIALLYEQKTMRHEYIYFIVLVTITSWAGLLAGLGLYVGFKDRYLFKWSYKKLIENHFK